MTVRIPMIRFIRFFETLIDPFREHDVSMPPPTLGGFYCTTPRQVWPVLAALMVVGFVVSLIECRSSVMSARSSTC